jgi:hypothetical protein
VFVAPVDCCAVRKFTDECVHTQAVAEGQFAETTVAPRTRYAEVDGTADPNASLCIRVRFNGGLDGDRASAFGLPCDPGAPLCCKAGARAHKEALRSFYKRRRQIQRATVDPHAPDVRHPPRDWTLSPYSGSRNTTLKILCSRPQDGVQGLEWLVRHRRYDIIVAYYGKKPAFEQAAEVDMVFLAPL